MKIISRDVGGIEVKMDLEGHQHEAPCSVCAKPTRGACLQPYCGPAGVVDGSARLCGVPCLRKHAREQ